MENGSSSYTRFLCGNESAFEEIMEEYKDGLAAFINRYVRDAEAAEDIAIDVFTYVLINPGKYNFKTSLKTYLYMLGRSRALDYVRRRKRRELTEPDAADVLAAPPEEKVFAAARREAVQNAMAKLPENMREALFLVYFEELSYEETAKIMKKTKKQVDNLLYRAKEKMRALLGKDGELWL